MATIKTLYTFTGDTLSDVYDQLGSPEWDDTFIYKSNAEYYAMLSGTLEAGIDYNTVYYRMRIHREPDYSYQTPTMVFSTDDIRNGQRILIIRKNDSRLKNNNRYYFANGGAGNSSKLLNVTLKLEEVTDVAPTTPGTFTSPGSGTILKGEEIITVSWGKSTDADNDTLTYYPQYRYYKNGIAQSWLTLINNNSSNTRNLTLTNDNMFDKIEFRVKSYDGTLYSGYRTSEVYSIVHNKSPLIDILDNKNESIAINQTVKNAERADFLFKIIPNDLDELDNIQYQVLLRNAVRTDWTNCEKTLEIPYSISYDDMLLGDNLITVKVRDNNGAEMIVNFSLTNAAPSTLSQRTVKDALNALGYTNTLHGSLNDLKPLGYDKNTISLQEIINSL